MRLYRVCRFKLVLNSDSETQLSSTETVLDLQLVALQMDGNTFVSQPGNERRTEARTVASNSLVSVGVKVEP